MSGVPLRRLGDYLQPVGKWNPDASGRGEMFTYIDISAIDQQVKEIREPQVIPVEEAPSRARQIVRANDVLVSTVRPNLNAVASVSDHFDGVIASTGFTVLRPQTESLDHRYLHHWVRSKDFVAYLVSRATGASYPAVSDGIVKDARIPLPDIDEQRRIAAIMDKADAIRRKRQQALALADGFLRSAFLEMFGDLASEKHRNPTTPLGELVDQARGISYGIVQRGDDDDNGVPVVRIGNFVDNEFSSADIVRTARTISDKFKRTILKGGELLLSIRGTVGRVAIAPPEACGFNVSREVAVIPLLQGVNPVFVRAAMLTPGAQRFMTDNVKGVAQRGINLKDVRELPIPRPKPNLLERFLRTSEAANRITLALKEPDRLFASLSQRAFRGEL